MVLATMRLFMVVLSLLSLARLTMAFDNANGVGTGLEGLQYEAKARRVLASGAPVYGLQEELFSSDATATEKDISFLVRDIATTRIVGGYITDPLKRPWMVAVLLSLSSGGQALCGGSYIGSAGGYHVILTAAHCVTGSVIAAYAFFDTDDLGAFNTDSDAYVLRHAKYKMRHEDYSSRSYTNDIGLLFFTDSDFNGPDPAILASSNMTLQAGEVVTVTGYGNQIYNVPYDDYTPSVDYEYSLREVSLELMADSTCKNIFTSVGVFMDMDVEICAMSQDKGSCSGDSGGPLIASRNSEEIVIGLVSWGVECADSAPMYPDVYTRVSYFEDWLRYSVELVIGDSDFLQFYVDGQDTPESFSNNTYANGTSAPTSFSFENSTSGANETDGTTWDSTLSPTSSNFTSSSSSGSDSTSANTEKDSNDAGVVTGSPSSAPMASAVSIMLSTVLATLTMLVLA